MSNLDPQRNRSCVKKNVRRSVSDQPRKTPWTLEKLTLWSEPSQPAAASRDLIKLFLPAPKEHHFFPRREFGPKLRHAKTRTRGPCPPSPRQASSQGRGTKRGRPNYAMLPLLYIMRQVKGKEEEENRPAVEKERMGRREGRREGSLSGGGGGGGGRRMRIESEK